MVLRSNYDHFFIQMAGVSNGRHLVPIHLISTEINHGNEHNIYVTLFRNTLGEIGIKMAKTGAERYFESRAQTAEYHDAYGRARSSIDEVDRIVSAIENKRISLGMSKAELARRVGIAPESVRRLLSAEHANPTLSTVVSLAKVLDLDIVAVKRRTRKQIA